MFYLGLGYQNIPDLPSNIDIGCHNSEDNVTLSGPADDMENYLETLKKRNVFVRTVNSNGIAYHSRMVLKQAKFVEKFINKVYFWLIIIVIYTLTKYFKLYLFSGCTKAKETIFKMGINFSSRRELEFWFSTMEFGSISCK